MSVSGKGDILECLCSKLLVCYDGIHSKHFVQAMLKRKVPIVRPFEFLSFGILAYVGGSKALAQVKFMLIHLSD